MRKLLILLALGGLIFATNGWAMPVPTVDGDISEWDADHVYTDPNNDSLGEGELLSWGFYYGGATSAAHNDIYYFIELDKDFSIYDAGDNAAFPGLWMDLDHYSGPVTQVSTTYRIKPNGRSDQRNCYTGPSVGNFGDSWVASEWKSATGELMLGVDILPELGLNDEGWNFWGPVDCLGAQGDAISDGAYAYQGQAVEMRVAIDEIIGDAKTYGDYGNGTFRNGNVSGLWKLGVRAAAHIDGASDWGVDCADPLYVPIIADFDNDSDCDLDDFADLAINYGSSGLTVPADMGANYQYDESITSSWEAGDWDMDGDVDLDDFAGLAVTFQMDMDTLGTSGGNVPEPITLVVLGLGGLLLRRKR